MNKITKARNRTIEEKAIKAEIGYTEAGIRMRRLIGENRFMRVRSHTSGDSGALLYQELINKLNDQKRIEPGKIKQTTIEELTMLPVRRQIINLLDAQLGKKCFAFGFKAIRYVIQLGIVLNEKRTDVKEILIYAGCINDDHSTGLVMFPMGSARKFLGIWRLKTYI